MMKTCVQFLWRSLSPTSSRAKGIGLTSNLEGPLFHGTPHQPRQQVVDDATTAAFLSRVAKTHEVVHENGSIA